MTRRADRAVRRKKKTKQFKFFTLHLSCLSKAPNLTWNRAGRQSVLLLSEFGKGWQFVIFLVLTAGEVNI
jgi:hypothetical protein